MMIPIKITREQEIECIKIALNQITTIGWSAQNAGRHDRELNFFEYVAQYAGSVAAEIAVQSYFGEVNIESIAEHKFKNKADLGANIEVKWAGWKDSGLWIQPYDRNGDTAVLVVGKSPTLYIVGWIPVIAAKSSRHANTSQGNWYVPQNYLAPMENFKRSNAGKEWESNNG